MSRARDTIAQAAMVVALAGVGDDARAGRDAQDLLARARVALGEAQRAVRNAREATTEWQAGQHRAEALITEARLIRAQDGLRRSVSSSAPGRKINLIVPAAEA